MTVLESINFFQTETLPNVSIHVSSSSSRNEYYLGGVMASPINVNKNIFLVKKPVHSHYYGYETEQRPRREKPCTEMSDDNLHVCRIYR